MRPLEDPDHLDTPPDHHIAVRVTRDDLSRSGKCCGDDVLWLLDLLGEQSLSPHEDVSLHAPDVEVGLTARHEDVVALVIELDGEHLVGGGRGLGDHLGSDLLLVKVSPDGDVGLLGPVNHGELGGPGLVQDREGEAGHLVGELSRSENVNRLQRLVVPDLENKFYVKQLSSSDVT